MSIALHTGSAVDRFIAFMPAEEDGDLMLCPLNGVAYQADRNHQVEYTDAYWNKCAGYEGEDIARKINAGRVDLVNRHIGANRVLDIGIGSGEFIRMRPNTLGFDVNQVALEWLKSNGLLAKNLGDFAGYTFWDVIEHVPEPETYFRHIKLHAYLFTSIPLFYGLGSIRESKHYRPGEHLYYWTYEGFLDWMGLHGFQVLEALSFEIDAGRENIYSFAFRRYRWPH